jgi:hypothetical protein
LLRGFCLRLELPWDDLRPAEDLRLALRDLALPDLEPAEDFALPDLAELLRDDLRDALPERDAEEDSAAVRPDFLRDDFLEADLPEADFDDGLRAELPELFRLPELFLESGLLRVVFFFSTAISVTILPARDRSRK